MEAGPAWGALRLAGVGSLVLAFLWLVGLLAWGLSGVSLPGLRPGGLDRAPDFTLPLLNGEGEISLADLRGKTVVLNFWASWCAPCREEAPVLEKVWRQYRERGVVFLGVNIDDTREGALKFLEEFGITYPSVYDYSGATTVAYRVTAIPTTYVVDRAGRIVRSRIGILSERRLISMVEDALR